MASGMRQLIPCLDVQEAMIFAYFCYFLPDFISSRSKILNQLRRYALQVSTVFNFPHAFQLLPQPDTEHQQFRVIFRHLRRMRSSFNALMNKGPEDNFMFTTILLLSISVYMGVAFKDIAVIKMIKGLGFLLELNWVYVDKKCRWNQNRSI